VHGCLQRIAVLLGRFSFRIRMFSAHHVPL
jgi:hypothetical protein